MEDPRLARFGARAGHVGEHQRVEAFGRFAKRQPPGRRDDLLQVSQMGAAQLFGCQSAPSR
jgi:hypothetical protein